MFRMDHVYGSHRDLKMSPFKYVRKQPKKWHYLPKLPEPEILLSGLEAGTLSNLVFSNEKKFNVQHHVNPHNDRVWSCNGGKTSKSHSGPRDGISDGLGGRY